VCLINTIMLLSIIIIHNNGSIFMYICVYKHTHIQFITHTYRAKAMECVSFIGIVMETKVAKNLFLKDARVVLTVFAAIISEFPYNISIYVHVCMYGECVCLLHRHSNGK